MSTYFIKQDFPRLGDLIQGETSLSIASCRKQGTVTGTVGKTLYIGDILIDNLDGTFTIPADIAAIVDPAKRLALYIGNDPIQNVDTNNPTYNSNITTFASDTLTQNVVVAWRGQLGLARGGVVGTSRGESGIRFPVGTTAPQMKTVWDKLTVVNGFTILRQVP